MKIRCESVDWIERNEVDSIEVAPGACLAFVATWTLPAFELTGCYSGSNEHGGVQAQVMSAAELALCTQVEGLSAVILVNGSIQGVWQYTTRRSQTVVKVHLFCSPTTLIQKGIEAEVERLSDFFKTKVLLEYEHLSSKDLHINPAIVERIEKGNSDRGC